VEFDKYLMVHFGARPEDCVFGRNFLGYGISHSPDQARNDQKVGPVDAWGVGYDQRPEESHSHGVLSNRYRRKG
jgi:hypothetical protein